MKLFVHKITKDEVDENQMLQQFPQSFKMGLSRLGLKVDEFIQYTVCIKCDSVYEFAACTERNSFGHLVTKHCAHVSFPNHPMRTRREPCRAPLLQKVCKNNSDCATFRPFKLYVYNPISNTLSRLFNRTGFSKMCEHWRQRHKNMEYMTDVYDGMLWQEWQVKNERDFLVSPFSLVTIINLDWFQPFTHVRYSVGVLYMVILNLPREERYKMENIILISIIPGPKEPKHTINSYLAPLVDELNDLWNGISVTIGIGTSSKRTVMVRLAVMCIACDIPAVRKMCGFAGHSACLGCSKFKHRFVSKSWGMDYSGFDRSQWDLRNPTEHKEHASKYLSAQSISQQDECVSENGVRYSVLLELPYLDIVRNHIIDPMHNLLLGTAKHVMKTWMAKGIVAPNDLKLLEERVSQIQCPYDVGRIPLKISSGFAGFTADQWLNWTVVYSVVALKGIADQNHYNCWLLYVKACSMLCCKFIKKSDVSTADQYLQQFCRNFEALYGEDACTPNMHLHLHLKESLLDYGPVYAFWLFTFERLNGTLGSYSTNNKNVEIQIMRKFLNHQKAKDLHFPQEYSEFYDLLLKCNETSGSLRNTSSPECAVIMKQMSNAPLNEIDSFKIGDSCKVLNPKSKRAFTVDELKKLEIIYKQLYPNKQIESISHFYTFANKAIMNNEIIGSVFSRNKKASVIGAYWTHEGSSLECIDYTKLLIGTIQNFIEHKLIMKDSDHTMLEANHLFCYIKWLIPHPERNWFGNSVTVSYLSESDNGPMNYMPIQRVVCRCAHTSMKLDFPSGTELVHIAIPLTRNYYLY